LVEFIARPTFELLQGVQNIFYLFPFEVDNDLKQFFKLKIEAE
jgi:hypothetical protein